MNTDELNSLYARRSDLKLQGRFEDAIPLQLQILAAVQQNGRIKEVSNAWNYLSMLYYRIGRYVDAEQASRKSITTYETETNPSDESVACYEMLLAKILASQSKFDDAISYGNMAIKHYSTFHDPPDDFLRGVQDEVNSMVKYRNRDTPTAG